jgi:hypothetical protein
MLSGGIKTQDLTCQLLYFFLGLSSIKFIVIPRAEGYASSQKKTKKKKQTIQVRYGTYMLNAL